jgi:hypothetical protein
MGSGASTPAASDVLEQELAKPPDASDITPGEYMERNCATSPSSVHRRGGFVLVLGFWWEK